MAIGDINGWNAARLDDLREDFRDFKKETRENFAEVKSTLKEMQDDDTTNLRTRADRPRVLLYALATPVLAAGFAVLVQHVLS